MVEAIQDLGLCSRGSGADNIRNVTGTPTAGIDPQELIDTRPYAREWHFHILNDRALYGLPRKFNVGFDGGGIIPVLEDTNDIGFQAVEVKDGFGVEPGVWFRLMLGGITGHKDFARETGVVVKPADATKVADAIVRVFIDHGDRTNRNKARLKYVLDAWGIDKFLAAVEEKLGRKLDARARRGAGAAPGVRPAAHIGVHPQKQAGLNWIGVVLPVGKLTADADARARQDRARFRRRRYPPDRLAEPADLGRAGRKVGARARRRSRRSASPPTRPRSAPGSSPAPAIPAASSRPPTPSATPRRSRAGAKPARARRPGQHPPDRLPSFLRAALYRRHRPARLQGADIARKATPSRAITSIVGGGFGPDAALGREIFRDVKAEDAPRIVERMLKAYLAHRAAPQETLSALHAPARGRRAQGDRSPAEAVRMSQTRAPPIPLADPGNAPFSPEQRAWLNGFFAGLLSLDDGVTPLSPEQAAALLPGVARRERTVRDRGRRRRAMARPGHAARRAHEACRRPAAAPADDGGDGRNRTAASAATTAGLFRRDLLREGRAAESLRARRQGNRPHAQGAASRSWATHRRPGRQTAAPQRRRCNGCASRRAGPIARKPGRGGLSLAHAAQQAGLRKGDLARRDRSRRHRHRLCGRRFLRRCSRPTIRRWSMR